MIKEIPKGVRTFVEGRIDSSLILRVENCTTCHGEIALMQMLGDQSGYRNVTQALEGAANLGYNEKTELGIGNIRTGSPEKNIPQAFLFAYDPKGVRVAIWQKPEGLYFISECMSIA